MSIKSFSPKRGNRGFTLLELIVVIVILGILAALAIPTFKRVIATSELETAEVTAAALVRETLALAAFNDDQLITDDSILAAAGDLPGEAYSPGEYAAGATGYQVVFGKWEFSGNERTISVIKGGNPVGSTLGVALYVPEVGCAFAKSEGSSVKAWSVLGLDPALCNGAGAYVDPEVLLGLSSPPVPAGLEITFGCPLPGGGEGWEITFDSGLADIFVNGVFVGKYASGACVPGKASDKVTAIVSNGDEPGWEGGLGDIYDNGSIGLPVDLPPVEEEPEVPAPIISSPVYSSGGVPVLIEWPLEEEAGTPEATRNGVVVYRQPALSPEDTPWVPVYTAGNSNGNANDGDDLGFIYDDAPAGNWVYKVQPTLNDVPLVETLPVTAIDVKTPLPVTSDGGNGSKPGVILLNGTALIAWGAVADTRAAPLTGYRVHASFNGAPYVPLSSTLKDITFLETDPLAVGEHCFRVSSYGPGGESGLSPESCIVVEGDSGSVPVSFKAMATTATSGEYLGQSVDIDGDLMVAGAYGENGQKGAAYVYARSGDTWVQEAKLTPDDGAATDFFGYSVAISGQTIVVGAPQSDKKNTNAGAVYVFTRSGTTWSKQSITLVASDGSSLDALGTSVDISGDFLIAGAPQNDDKGSNSGSAYVFARSGTTWAQRPVIVPSDGVANDLFGSAVTISGDTAAIGSYWDDDKGVNSGSVYVHNRIGTSWFLQTKLTAPDGVGNDTFGRALTLDGNTLAVGSPLDDDKGADSGSVNIFTRSGTTWSHQAKIVAESLAELDLFGTSVGLSGTTLVVGAHQADTRALNSGDAFVFSSASGSWVEQANLAPEGVVASDYFGRSVAVSAGKVVVGSEGDDEKATNAGAAYIFIP